MKFTVAIEREASRRAAHANAVRQPLRSIASAEPVAGGYYHLTLECGHVIAYTVRKDGRRRCKECPARVPPAEGEESPY